MSVMSVMSGFDKEWERIPEFSTDGSVCECL